MVKWFQNNDYSEFPLAETQPFIYVPETNELHMGEPGSHHWAIFNKDKNSTGVYGLYNPIRNIALIYPLQPQGQVLDTSASDYMAARAAINSLSKQSATNDIVVPVTTNAGYYDIEKGRPWIRERSTGQRWIADKKAEHADLVDQIPELHSKDPIESWDDWDELFEMGYEDDDGQEHSYDENFHKGSVDSDIARWVYFPNTDTVEFGGMDDEHMDLVQKGSPTNDGNYGNFYGGYVNKDGSLDLTYTPNVNWVPSYILGKGDEPPPPEVAARVQEELAKQKTSAWEDPDELYNRLAALFVL